MENQFIQACIVSKFSTSLVRLLVISLFICSLWANTPKEIIEYTDYTFYDHYGCSLPSFMPRALTQDYLIGRAKANNLRRFIRFNTVVRNVDFDEKKKEFSVEIEDFNVNSVECQTFDRVIVATGHYHVPNMVDIDGVDQFPGRVLHSHEFRGADEFIGLNLLIIGGSMTAEDIALQCYKFGARSTTVSSRQVLNGYKWPETIKGVPMVIRMEGRTAHFNDGSSMENIDAIIFCTGYRHSYPFMTRRLRLYCGVTDFVATSLYKSIFWIDQPYLAYLGVPRQLYTFSMFDAQAALVRDVFLGNIQLIDQNQWQADANAWRIREKALSPIDIPGWIDFQTDYIRDILALLSPDHDDQSLLKFDIDQRKSLYKKYLEEKFVDLLGYRNLSFTSVIDSKKQTTVPAYKPWIENVDETMENFLKNYKQT